MQNPSRTIERELTHLRLTTEEVFHETFRVLDEVKENPKDASFMMRGLWDSVYCDLRELDEDAATKVDKVAHRCSHTHKEVTWTL